MKGGDFNGKSKMIDEKEGAKEECLSDFDLTAYSLNY